MYECLLKENLKDKILTGYSALQYFKLRTHTKVPYIANCSRWKSFAVTELNCNSLENFMVGRYTKAYCTSYFIGKILRLLIDH